MKQQTKIFSPKEFLKSRRPERFTDSIIKETGKLDRAVLEYQLSTLNRRSLELSFEGFAKSLCEKIICPNLLSQTGPVAGGDGKTDTQTFPVSEQIKAIRWYVGLNDNANQDRWAFAVSTNEDWKQKCRSDVRKIVGTERGYKKIFCVTNQYCKSNQRSDLEDSLSEETGVDIRILDVSWVLDEIFEHGYEQLAIDFLSIEIDWRRETVNGSNDYSKKIALEQLREKIKDINPDDITRYQISWFLDEAILCKELEYPIIESRGLFDRAVNIAEQLGNTFHQFEAHYQYAWTAYWWYENESLFEKQLEKCFQHAQKIKQSGIWGNFITLLGLYLRFTKPSLGEKSKVNTEEMISITNSFLTEMSLDESRPSNALLAKAHIALLELFQIESIESASAIFSNIELVVDQSRHLVGFPFQEVYELISSLDMVFYENKNYENLLDKLTAQTIERYGEIEGSLLWLSRGAKRLESEKPYQAIKLIGKSLAGLYKEESKKDIYAALNLLSHVYQKINLFWASRANLLLSGSLITEEFWKSGDLYPAQVTSYVRLAKAELILGRINYALSWWELALIIDANLEESAIPEHDSYSFDGYLAHCILNTQRDALRAIETLPDKLNNLQLIFSHQCILYALGYEEKIDEEFVQGLDDQLIEFMIMVRDCDLGVKVAKLATYQERYSSLNSSIMGCFINISCPQKDIAIQLAETLLSVIEGFFATCIIDQVIALEPRLNIDITLDDDDVGISHVFIADSSILTASILLSSLTNENIRSEEVKIKDWLREFIIEIFLQVFRAKDLEKTVKEMLGEDRALERSISFGNCLFGQINIMGNDAYERIQSFLNDSVLKDYPLVRDIPWDIDFPKSSAIAKPREFKLGAEKEPEELFNYERLSHSDTHVQSLIKSRLWDQTTWTGVAFAQYPNMPPVMLLTFKDPDTAEKILHDLKNEVGLNNKEDRLQISIIRKINKNFPAHYRVVISEPPNIGEPTKFIQTVSRLNTMEPENEINLTRFIENYKKSNCYLLSYAYYQNGQIYIPDDQVYIQIKKLNLIEAWQVGINSLELVGIRKSDDPFIPNDVENIPYLEVKEKYFQH